jgi:hypothetical protein
MECEGGSCDSPQVLSQTAAVLVGVSHWHGPMQRQVSPAVERCLCSYDVYGAQDLPTWPNITTSGAYLEGHTLADPLERSNAIR